MQVLAFAAAKNHEGRTPDTPPKFSTSSNHSSGGKFMAFAMA
jgi:hypothetical protein